MYYMANVFGFRFPNVIDVFLFRLVRFCHPADPISDNIKIKSRNSLSKSIMSVYIPYMQFPKEEYPEHIS
jgi:hypothetical protein